MSDLADPLYVPEEAASLLKSNAQTLERWRSTGTGPPFVKVGRRVAYRLSDLENWLVEQRRRHTSERAEGGR